MARRSGSANGEPAGGVSSGRFVRPVTRFSIHAGPTRSTAGPPAVKRAIGEERRAAKWPPRVSQEPRGASRPLSGLRSPGSSPRRLATSTNLICVGPTPVVWANPYGFSAAQRGQLLQLGEEFLLDF
jgi:hypothetical protein